MSTDAQRAFDKIQCSFMIKKKISMVNIGSFHCGAVETNPTSIHEDSDLIPDLAQCVKDPALL